MTFSWVAAHSDPTSNFEIVIAPEFIDDNFLVGPICSQKLAVQLLIIELNKFV